jgi:hypothetical protein
MTLRTDQLDSTTTLGNHAADHRDTNTQVNQNTAAIATLAAGLGASYVAYAANPDTITFGTITRNTDSAVTSATVVWPDGTAGVFTSDVLSSAYPGAVDSYHITYLGSSTVTYTQPTVTRDSNGAVTTRPAMVVS